MATNTDDIYVKMQIDTSQFDSSIAGMKREITSLKGLVGSSILSKDEQSQVLSRMATLKDEIKDIQQATGSIKGLEIFARGMAPVIAGFGAITGAAKQFGLEIKGIENAERIMMTTMNAALALQQLADLKNLASIAKVTAARWLGIAAVKGETAAVGAATVAQRVWNAVLAASPIGAMVTAVALLVAGIVILTRDTEELKDATEDYNEALNYSKTATDNANKQIQSQIIELKKLAIQRKLTAGEITEAEAKIQLQQLENSTNFQKAAREAAVTSVQRKKAVEELTAAEKELARIEEIIKVTTESGGEVDLYTLKKAGDLEKTIQLRKQEIALFDQTYKTQTKAAENEYKIGQQKVDIIKQETSVTKENTKAKSDNKKEDPEAKKYEEWVQKRKQLDEQVYQAKLNAGTATADEIFNHEIQLYQDLYNQGEIDYATYLKHKQIAWEKAIKESKQVITEDMEMPEFKFPWADKPIPPILPTKEEQEKQMQELFQTIATYTQYAAQAVNLILQYSMEAFNTQIENQMNEINKQYESSVKELDKLLKYQVISQAEYDKRKKAAEEKKAQEEKDIKTKQAKKQKEYSIIQAIVNTAVGVTQALASSPPPANFILAAVVGALGALEVALIASQPLPEFRKGGYVKKMANGGYLNGPSHEMGGVPLVAEGGEFIVRKSVAQKPGMGEFLTNLNNPSASPTYYSGISPEDMNSIATSVTRSIMSIPVNVVETDITRTQKTVNVIETKASW